MNLPPITSFAWKSITSGTLATDRSDFTMKILSYSLQLACSTLLLFSLLKSVSSMSYAGDDSYRTSPASGYHFGPAWGIGWPKDPVHETHPHTIGRVDLDADLNFDGVVTDDGSDSGPLEKNPPGLIIGKGMMSKFVIRLTPFNGPQRDAKHDPEIDFDKLMVSLELRVINFRDRKGIFDSAEDEQRNAGHLRVWSDDQCSKLLIDSRDSQKRRIEWRMDAHDAPGFVYVECADPSSTSASFVLLLKLDEVTSREYQAKRYNPYAANDWILISCRNQQPEIVPDPSAKPVRRLPGYGNYANFLRTDRDDHKVWVKSPMSGK